MNDYQILGIQEGSSLSEVKKAYRTRVKESHPDTAAAEDEFKNHLLFIEINKAYQRIIGSKEKKRVVKRQPTGKAETISPQNGGEKVVVHKDPAYVFYKTGMNYFMKIHPSQWSRNKSKQLPDPEKEEDIDKLKEKVRSLASLFPKSYYYFSIVVNEYPECPWYQDAKEKMIMIEERTVMYRKIIESFSEFKKAVPRVNRILYR